MDFALSAEQEMIVTTVRDFVETEIYPHEDLVERTGEVPPELAQEIKRKVIEMGFYACNFPEEVGGGGLGHLDFTLVERELGRGSMALTHFFGRPQNILMACEGDQKEKYLFPAVRGERMDALAMTEPGAGSDVRGMSCAPGAAMAATGWSTGRSISSRAPITRISSSSSSPPASMRRRKVRRSGSPVSSWIAGIPGFTVRDGYQSVSHRGYKNCILEFDDCRLPDAQVLGEVDGGFEVMNTWLYATRLTVAAFSVGRARRCFDHAVAYAAERKQFGQPIAKFQGVSFPGGRHDHRDRRRRLADAGGGLAAGSRACPPTGRSRARSSMPPRCWRVSPTRRLQIFGGMGLMSDFPIERFWRDARVERIWDGTSEIQRHIISRDLFRPLGPDATCSRCRAFCAPGRSPSSAAGPGAPMSSGNVARSAFPGPVWPVHPTRETVGGCLRSLGRGAARGTRRGLHRGEPQGDRRGRAHPGGTRGGRVRSASPRASGNRSETGDGDTLEAALVEAAGGCGSSARTATGFSTFPRWCGALARHPRRGAGDRGVALITQSSNIALNLTMQARAAAGLCHDGGQPGADGMAEVAEALLEDERVTALGLHIEGIGDVAAFEAMAGGARRAWANGSSR
jgi:acyl-CoA dehydrogenase